MGDPEREYARSITGEHEMCPNPLCMHRFRELEARVKRLENDDTIKDLMKTLTEIEKELAGLKGKLSGYLFAGGLIGTIVGALVAVVASAYAK